MEMLQEGTFVLICSPTPANDRHLLAPTSLVGSQNKSPLVPDVILQISENSEKCSSQSKTQPSLYTILMELELRYITIAVSCCTSSSNPLSSQDIKYRHFGTSLQHLIQVHKFTLKRGAMQHVKPSV